MIPFTRTYPGSTPLLIQGIPMFRYDLARESRHLWQEAEAALGPGMIAPCYYELVDKLGERPPLRKFFDRGRVGFVRSEDLFDAALREERIPGTEFEVKPKGKPAYWTRGTFRHCTYFATITIYEPHTQVELDAMRARRDEKARAKELAAAPLFAGGVA